MQLVDHHLFVVPLVIVVPDEYAVFGPMVDIPAVGRAPAMAVTFIRFRRNIDPGNLDGGAVHEFANTTLWCGLSWESAAPTAVSAVLRAVAEGPAFDSENPEDVACLPSGPLAILGAAQVELEVAECRTRRAAAPGVAVVGEPAEPQTEQAAELGEEAAADTGGGGGDDDDFIIPVTISAALGLSSAHPVPRDLTN